MALSSKIPRLAARHWPVVVLLPLAICFTLLGRFPLERAREALRFPYQLDAEEGFLLGQALRLASGEGLYPPISERPYVVDNYPPLYPALWSLAARWAGPSLAPGRWIVLAASLAIAAAIAVIVWRCGRSVLLAWLCPALFLTSAEHLRWMAYARVDLPAVAFGLWGLAALVLCREEKRWSRILALAFFALAFLTKQTALAAPAAAAIYLVRRDRAGALRFVLLLALALAVPAAILTAWTRGRYCLHLVAYNRNLMRWGELRGWLRLLWSLYAPLIGVLAVLAVWAIRVVLLERRASGEGHEHPQTKFEGGTPIGKGETDFGGGTPIERGKTEFGGDPSGGRRQRPQTEFEGESPVGKSEPEGAGRLVLFLTYFALCVLSLLSLAKAGAAENYLLEPLCAAAIFLGVSLGALLRRQGRPAWSPLNLVASVAVLGLMLLHGVHFFAGGLERHLFLSAPRATAAALVQGDHIVREIRARPGDVLCEDPIYALKAGRPIVFQHFIMAQLAAEGKWDPVPVARMAARKAFSLVAAHQDLLNENQFFDRYPPALRKALRENYALLDRLDRGRLQSIWVYVPRKSVQE